MLKGSIVINEDRCKGCGLCINVCPSKILALAMDRFNVKGYHPVSVVSPGNCSGCGACAMICPDVVFTVYRSANKKQSVPVF
ncbi:MAG: 4Fe-4S binding protein [Anaerolineae bacterium]|nr:4Fe-4S binding protein [Anaerolineae bacterium]